MHVNLNATVKAWCHLEPCRRTEANELIYATRRAIDGVEDPNLEDALFAFKLGEKASFVKPFGSGHINDCLLYTSKSVLPYVLSPIRLLLKNDSNYSNYTIRV